jgi:hypothetical protein
VSLAGKVAELSLAWPQVLSYQKHKRGEDGLEEQEVKYATSKTTPDDTNDNRKSLNRKLQVLAAAASL